MRETRDTGVLGLALLLGALACGHAAERPAPPRLADEHGVDPLVLERVHEGLAACERGEPRALLELAKTYEANDLDLLALSAFEQCLALPAGEAGAPLAELHFHRGRTLHKLGRSEEALAAFSEAIAREADYAPSFWRRGELRLEGGQVAEARADFERALALEPDGMSARLGLARVCLLEEDPKGAVAALQAVVERQPDERFAHGLLARAYRALGDEARAREELAREERADQITSNDPRSAEVRKRATGVIAAVKRANSAIVKGKPAEALAVLEPLYEQCPEDLAVLQMLAKALVVAGKNERALAVLEKANQAHPDDYKLELYTGLALLGEGLTSPALAHLEAARALNPAYGPTHAALGELETRLGHLEEAEASFLRALEGQEVELSSFVSLGLAQMRRSAWERAGATFERACREYPEAAAPWTHLAETQVRRGLLSEARASLAQAQRRNPAQGRLAEVEKLLRSAEGGAR